MNVLVLNVHSPQNAGDLAILEETLDVLRRAVPDAEITIAINDSVRDRLPAGVVYTGSFMRWVVRTDSDGEWHWRKPLALLYAAWLIFASLIFRWTGKQLFPHKPAYHPLMRAYYDADVVAVIGGGHLYARHAANIAFIWLWIGIALAPLMRKPLILLPQSFGPLPGRVQRAMLRWLVSRSAFVAAREDRSVSLLADLKLQSRVLLLPDLAFTAREAEAQALDAALPVFAEVCAKHVPIIGITLMDWLGQNPQFHNQQGYEAAISELIKHVTHCYRAQVVLFAQCTGPTRGQDDRLIARRIGDRALAEHLPVLVIDEALGPEMLKAAYHRLDILVATRMHSAIFALSNSIPTLAIGYLYKSIGIMNMLGLAQYTLDIDTIDTQQLTARFDALWQDRSHVRRKLARRMPAIAATLGRLPELIQKSLVDSHA